MSNNAFERLTDHLRLAGQTVRDTGHGKAQAQCPAHDDGRASLSITGIDGQVLVYCHAGCDTADVLAALNLAARDLFDKPRGADYHYPDGRQVTRTPEKRFWQAGNTKGRSLFRTDLTVLTWCTSPKVRRMYSPSNRSAPQRHAARWVQAKPTSSTGAHCTARTSLSLPTTMNRDASTPGKWRNALLGRLIQSVLWRPPSVRMPPITSPPDRRSTDS